MTSIRARLTSMTKFTHSLLKEVLLPGDIVVDATVGNGHDTLFLAEMVGSEGKVYGFDIQKQGLDNAEILLRSKDAHRQVHLLHSGHEHIEQLVPGSIKAATFNLGYLPKGDHNIVTIPETTIIAIKGAMNKLDFGGIITIMVYIGHPGGKKESDQVEEYLKQVDKKAWDILKWQFVNRESSPYLIVISRREG